MVGVVVLSLPKTGPLTVTERSRHQPEPTAPTGSRISATGDDRGAGGTITDAEYFIDTLARPATARR